MIRPPLLTGLFALCLGCAAPRPDKQSAPGSYPHHVEGRHGVVVSVSGPATAAGLAVLAAGGNAVDAAIAVAFALAPAYPLAGNVAGGGFMLVYPGAGGGEPTVIDYRETAPSAARPTMFGPSDSQYSHRAVAVPGTVRGLALAHRRFGRLPWARLVAPAIAIAREGVVLDANSETSLNATLAAAKGLPEFQRVFGKPGGGPWRVGDRLFAPDLAQTLEILSREGPDAFYRGPIARAIVDEMARGGGLVTADDLAGYQAIVRQPLHIRYQDRYDVFVPPPPSSGGVCLLEELQMLQALGIQSWGRLAAPGVHIMVEAMRRANYDRARFLGDPAFSSLPPELLSPAHARALADTIDFEHATPSETLAKEIPLVEESDSTTHFSVIDADGMAVSNTYTLERRWGSRIVVPGTGILLNNDMWAFNLFPGRTDRKGNIGTRPNTIAPGKRMLSSQTPTIVAERGRVRIVTGSPGSRSIPHTILTILVGLLDFGSSVDDAVSAPRFSHQWFPDEITFEQPERYPELVERLRALGHKITRAAPYPLGDAHTIWVRDDGLYVGVADERLSGAAGGF